MIRWQWAVIAVAFVVLVAALWYALGPSAAGAGGVLAGFAGWLWGRSDRSSRAHLDLAAEIGARDIKDANAVADEEIAHGMDVDGNLADFVNGRIKR